MRSDEASAMLLAIGLQESKFLFRSQMGSGPARGFWQFERGGGVVGVQLHATTGEHLRKAAWSLRYPTLTSHDAHAAIQHNDVLAAVFARLLLWTLPGRLPDEGEHVLAWQQYLDAWRPGKPHPETWEVYYASAWDVVRGRRS